MSITHMLEVPDGTSDGPVAAVTKDSLLAAHPCAAAPLTRTSPFPEIYPAIFALVSKTLAHRLPKDCSYYAQEDHPHTRLPVSFRTTFVEKRIIGKVHCCKEE
jgi:hypothetical protein